MLRIATFNLESFGGEPGDDGALGRRVAALRPTVQALDADILCLQEVNARRERKGEDRSFRALDLLLDGTSYAGFHRAHSTRSSGRSAGKPLDRHNLVTLSRWPIRTARSIHHELVRRMTYRGPAEPSLRVEWDRPILLSEHAFGRRVLHVVNLHLRAPLASAMPRGRDASKGWHSSAAWAEGFFVSVMKRSGQALEARLAVDAILDRDPRALIAVAGDLNADAFEMPMRLLQAPAEGRENPALAARTLVAVEQRVPAAGRYTAIHDGRRMLVDHILVSAPLATALDEVRILNAGVRNDMAGGGFAPPPVGSFHGAIVASFDLAAEPAPA